MLTPRAPEATRTPPVASTAMNAPWMAQARGVARYRLPLGRGDVGPPRVAGGGMDALPLMVFGVRRLDRPERSIIRFSAAPHHTCAVLHAAWYGRSRGTTTR